ncbi:hypothetical protein QFZ97_000556 [Paraburkholderia youngii]
MQWFTNLKLSHKLVGSLMLCAFVTAIVGTVGVLKVREVATMQTEMYDRYGGEPHFWGGRVEAGADSIAGARGGDRGC